MASPGIPNLMAASSAASVIVSSRCIETSPWAYRIRAPDVSDGKATTSGKMRTDMGRVTCMLACAAGLALDASAQTRLQSSDLLKLRSVTAVQLSPDATRVAYVVENNDGAGRPYGQLWVMTLAAGKTVRLDGDNEASGSPEWSPDGQSIAYRGRVGDKSGIVVSRPDGSGARFVAEMTGTNAPLPGTGKAVAWSPDGTRIAF